MLVARLLSPVDVDDIVWLVGEPRDVEPAGILWSPHNLAVLLSVLPVEVATGDHLSLDHGVIVIDLLVYLGQVEQRLLALVTECVRLCAWKLTIEFVQCVRVRLQ